MRFLFIGQGYPRAGLPATDSGIGKYLREMCLGLMARGHECDVIAWQDEVPGKRPQTADHRPQTKDSRQQAGSGGGSAVLRLVSEVSCEEGVTVYRLPHAYWPILERFLPDSRDQWNLRRLVRGLDRERNYDWLEIQSEEGIAIGVLKDFPGKSILRIHTTLEDMVRDKNVSRNYRVRYRLAREASSFRLARRVVTHSRFHAECLVAKFPYMRAPIVVPHGYDESHLPNLTRVPGPGHPIILIVGTPDRRKGFDRIMPVLRALVAECGRCTARLVSRCDDATRSRFELCPPFPPGLVVEWREGLSRQELMTEYANASVLLQLSRYESFGWPVIEAASQGTPVVATPVGTVPELLVGPLAVCMVDGADVMCCVRAIRQAIQDAAYMGAHLRARYEQMYTRASMVRGYLKAAMHVDDDC